MWITPGQIDHHRYAAWPVVGLAVIVLVAFTGLPSSVYAETAGDGQLQQAQRLPSDWHHRQVRSSEVKGSTVSPVIQSVKTALQHRSASPGRGYAPPLSHQIAGGEAIYRIQPGDNVAALASRFGVDGDLLARKVHLYPLLDYDLYTKPLAAGSRLAINNRYIVPANLQNGILVSIAQRRVFLFRNGLLIHSYPAAVGHPEWQTPTGRFEVIKMQKDPPWVVPRSIQEDMRAAGEKVVKFIRPRDPENPLGAYWIGLSLPNIGIHGTISPYSIYRFESHGCIRLENRDVQQLASMVALHEQGEAIYEPFLMAKTPDGRIYLEVHPDIYGKHKNPFVTVQAMAAKYHFTSMIDWQKAGQVIQRQEGIAENVTLSPALRLVDHDPLLAPSGWMNAVALPLERPATPPTGMSILARLEQWLHSFSLDSIKAFYKDNVQLARGG